MSEEERDDFAEDQEQRSKDDPEKDKHGSYAEGEEQSSGSDS